MICSFFGKSEIYNKDSTLLDLEITIKKLIAIGVDEFFCGFIGDFDYLCAHAVNNLKSRFPNIKLFGITPYILPSYHYKNEEVRKNCDMLLYPPIEHIPYKFSILKRNEWMINESDFVITYIESYTSKSHIAFEYAKKKNKKIINIAPYASADFITPTIDNIL